MFSRTSYPSFLMIHQNNNSDDKNFSLNYRLCFNNYLNGNFPASYSSLTFLRGQISMGETYQCILQDSEAQCILDAPDSASSIDTPNDHTSLLNALAGLAQSAGLTFGLSLPDIQARSHKPVAAGGFGDVYKGQYYGRAVAVKVYRFERSSDASTMVKAIGREAIIFSQLNHANLLPVYGIHVSINNSLSLVSPWMENGNVLQYLKANPGINRLLLVSDIARGMAYLHEHHRVHGDLKGANVLISGSGRALLSNSAPSRICHALMQEWASIQTISPDSGNLHWKAPELFEEDDPELCVSTSSDVYAFACVCYEIMTGEQPFANLKYEHHIMLQVMRGSRPPKPAPDSLAFQRYGLDEGIWAFIEKCWKQDRNDRLTAPEILRHDVFTCLDDPRPQPDDITPPAQT